MIASIIFVLSQCCNSVQDAINFTDLIRIKKYNHIWHVLKWVFDRPLLFVSGILFSDIIKEYVALLKSDYQYWLWHYTSEIYILFIAIVLGLFFWQVVYKLTVKYIRSHR